MAWILSFDNNNRSIKLLDNNKNDLTKTLKHPISNPDNDYAKDYIINYENLEFKQDKIIKDFGNVYNNNLSFNGYFAYCFNDIDDLIIDNAFLVFFSSKNHYHFKNIKHLIIKDNIYNKNLLIEMNDIINLHINFSLIQHIDFNELNVNKIKINNELEFLKINIFDPIKINNLIMKSNKFFINNEFDEISNKKKNLNNKNIHQHINKIIINDIEY